MIYLVLFILLFAAELLYFRIAARFNIIDKPNERSSHNYITIRGGGIIYWVAAFLFLVFNFSPSSLWFFAGITLIASAARTPRTRRATKPTRGAQLRRLEGKTQRAKVKALRGKISD